MEQAGWMRQERWLFLAVLIIAGVMRLLWIGAAEFLLDEAYLSLMALDALAERRIPLLGMPSSVGFPNAPVSVYIMMLPYAFTDNPALATAFVALLNVAGVGLLYLLGRRLFGRWVGFVAAIAYAVSPWAVLYSRKIWTQNMLTPFLLFAIYLGVRGFVDGKKWGQVVFLPLLFFTVQFHYAAWALLPMIIWFVYSGVKKRTIHWQSVAISIVLALGVITPFVLGLWGLDNANGSSFFASLSGESLRFDLSPLRHYLWFVTSLGLESYVAPERPWEILGGLVNLRVLWASVSGALVITGLVVIWHKRSEAVLLLLWLILPLLVFTPGWTDSYSHYFIGSIPALALVGGCGYVWLMYRLNRLIMLGIGAMTLSLLAAVWFQVLDYGVHVYVERGYGRSINALLAVERELESAQDVVLVSNEFRDYEQMEPTYWSVLLWNNVSCLRVVDAGRFTVMPDQPYSVLWGVNAPERDEYAGDRVSVIPLRDGEGQYRVGHVDNMSDWSALSLSPTDPILFANGVQLVGLELDRALLSLEWELPASDPGNDVQYFAHFLDANGEKIGQRDTDFVPGRYWCDGDRLITRIDVNAPPETAIVRVGMYKLLDGGGFENIAMVDQNGNVLDVWGDVPLPE